MIKKIRIDEAEVKAKSKREMYSLLASSGGLYLPQYLTLTSSSFSNYLLEKKVFTYFI